MRVGPDLAEVLVGPEHVGRDVLGGTVRAPEAALDELVANAVVAEAGAAARHERRILEQLVADRALQVLRRLDVVQAEEGVRHGRAHLSLPLAPAFSRARKTHGMRASAGKHGKAREKTRGMRASAVDQRRGRKWQRCCSARGGAEVKPERARASERALQARAHTTACDTGSPRSWWASFQRDDENGWEGAQKGTRAKVQGRNRAAVVGWTATGASHSVRDATHSLGCNTTAAPSAL